MMITRPAITMKKAILNFTVAAILAAQRVPTPFVGDIVSDPIAEEALLQRTSSTR